MLANFEVAGSSNFSENKKKCCYAEAPDNDDYNSIALYKTLTLVFHITRSSPQW